MHGQQNVKMRQCTKEFTWKRYRSLLLVWCLLRCCICVAKSELWPRFCWAEATCVPAYCRKYCNYHHWPLKVKMKVLFHPPQTSNTPA